jgi:hypothetical protein
LKGYFENVHDLALESKRREGIWINKRKATDAKPNIFFVRHMSSPIRPKPNNNLRNQPNLYI